MVFYDLNGQTVGRQKGEFKDKRSPDQLAHRERVRRAAAWARQTVTDPRQRADYGAACRGHQTPYNLALRDYMRPPVIESVNLESYTGKAGESVRVKATDDFEVT